MKTIIIGDIGGHLPLFKRILSRLEIDENYKVPKNVRIIQVGDMVRAYPHFRESNTILLRIVQKLTENNPIIQNENNGRNKNNGEWMQLLGNHEVPLLSKTHAPPFWKIEESFEPEIYQIMQQMMKMNSFRNAVIVNNSLITHSGLTGGYWKDFLDSETNIYKVEEKLNSFIVNSTGSSVSQINNFLNSLNAGMLITKKEPNLSSDFTTAMPIEELVESWMNLEMPFDQFHGHSAYYSRRGWYPNMRNEWKKFVKYDEIYQQSSFIFPNGHSLNSVDWVLSNSSPDVIPPLLEFNE